MLAMPLNLQHLGFTLQLHLQTMDDEQNPVINAEFVDSALSDLQHSRAENPTQ